MIMFLPCCYQYFNHVCCYRGKGEYYRLGTDNTTHVKEPQPLESLTKKVVQIAVGSLHVLALTDNGEVSNSYRDLIIEY